MEDKVLEACKKFVTDKEIQYEFIEEYNCPFKDISCTKCPFDVYGTDCPKEGELIEDYIQLAQNYIKEHEKTVNTINSVEEQTITLDDLKDIKENNIVPTYYHKGNYDVIEFCNKYEIGFVTGNIIKYIVRYKNKNGIEDLKKVKEYLGRRYIENLIIDSEDKLKFYEENNLNYKQGIILDLVLDNCHKKAEEMLNSLIKYEEKKESDING